MTTIASIFRPARTLMLIIAAVIAPRILAQEQVPSIVEQQHDLEWYKQQITLWEARVADTPADENAWRNLFAATRYATFEESQNDQSARTKAMNVVLSRMESAIPNSFTYHLCAFQAANSKEHDDAALALMPDTIVYHDTVYQTLRDTIRLYSPRHSASRTYAHDTQVATSSTPAPAANASLPADSTTKPNAQPLGLNIFEDGVDYSMLVACIY